MGGRTSGEGGTSSNKPVQPKARAMATRGVFPAVVLSGVEVVISQPDPSGILGGRAT